MSDNSSPDVKVGIPFSLPNSEEMSRIKVLGSFLADVIGRRWLETGVWKGLLDGINKRIINKNDVTSSFCELARIANNSYKKVKVTQFNPETETEEEIETTVPQLLADIRSQLDELNDQFDFFSKKKNTPRKRKKHR